MKIENDSIIESKPIGLVEHGCPFTYRGGYYITTNATEDSMILCVSLDHGTVMPFNPKDEVILINAKVVIE